VVEDKLLQIAVSRILNAIYEPLFLPCSWTYRIGRNAREAVRTLKQELQFGCYGYVVFRAHQGCPRFELRGIKFAMLSGWTDPR
jgi:retron-type reverse transcriptase